MTAGVNISRLLWPWASWNQYRKWMDKHYGFIIHTTKERKTSFSPPKLFKMVSRNEPPPKKEKVSFLIDTINYIFCFNTFFGWAKDAVTSLPLLSGKLSTCCLYFFYLRKRSEAALTFMFNTLFLILLHIRSFLFLLFFIEDLTLLWMKSQQLIAIN